MFTLHAEKLNDLTVVECEGRITHSDSVFHLRDLVMAQADSRVIALDLSEVKAISGGGLGMLAFLNNWAHQHGIEFKLFKPSKVVMEGLVQNRSILNFDIATFHEMMNMLAEAEPRYALAA
jgi:anti-anti-sigma regulatory factor